MTAGQDHRADLPALQNLLSAYAPVAQREWQMLCWQFDQRLAAIARRGGEPTIAAIRMAWWDAVLVEQDRSKGGGEPLVERWRAIAPAGIDRAAGRVIDGWRLLVAPEPLSDADLLAHAVGRGGGLFTLLAGAAQADKAQALDAAGQLWALWDLAAHVRDEPLARRAVALARDAAAGTSHRLTGPALKPARLALAVALPDLRAGRVPGAPFSPRHYARLLLAALRG